MRNTVLPWESVPGQKYNARNTLQRTKWTKTGGWLLVAILLLGGVVTQWKVAFVFAVLYALALIMEKYVTVTERGLEIFYQMQFTTNYDRWDWQDIYAVTHEPDPHDSALTVLYFTKGDRTKHNSFDNGDAKAILKLAKKRNPEIRIYDGKETRNKAEAIRNRGKTRK